MKFRLTATVAASALLLGLAPAAFADNAPAPAAAIQAQQGVVVPPLGFTRRVLPNGLEVYSARDTNTSNVTVQVWYKVGSKDDPAGRSGFAHLFEHLMFKATKNLPSESFDRLTEDVGGGNNAFTADDVTAYHETIPANHLQRLLFAEARRSAEVMDLPDGRRVSIVVDPRDEIDEVWDSLQQLLGLCGLVDAQDMRGLYERFLDPRAEGFKDPARWDEVSTLGQRGQHHRQRRAADAGGGPGGGGGREVGDRGHQRVGGAVHPSGNAHHQVDVDLAAGRQSVAVEQPVQSVHLAEVEQLELRGHAALQGELVEVLHEGPRVEEDVVAEVGRAHGERARVGLGVEHLEPLVERVVHGAAGGELDDERGRLAHRGDPLAQQCLVERGLVGGVAHVDVDHRRTGCLAVGRGASHLLRGGRELRAVGLRRLGARRCHRDEQFVHARTLDSRA